jgi:hypothetical protein
MYRKLAIQGEAAFFLETEGGNNRKRLNDIYMQVAVGESWPRGTKRSEVSEWNFTCRVQTKTLSNYPACKFTYLDYAGVHVAEVTEDDDSDSSDFDQKLEEADAFLGLLDGGKILSFMQGSREGDILIFRDLPNILQIMSRCGIENPVHFVISKWDLIDGKFSLEEIRERLLQISDFKQLVENRITAGSQVRLIPVSSVGMNFAVPQSDGSMKKIPEQLPQPFQIEMPLACVLPAKFRFELNRLNKQKSEEAARVIEVKPNYTIWDSIRLLIADAIETGWDLLPENYQFGEKVFQRLINFAEEDPRRKQEEAKKRTEELRQERDATIKAVGNEETALDHVIASFLYLESVLDSKFPASNIRL